MDNWLKIARQKTTKETFGIQNKDLSFNNKNIITADL